MHKTAEQVQTV